MLKVRVVGSSPTMKSGSEDSSEFEVAPQAKGLNRSQARGHPKAADFPTGTVMPIGRMDRLERALKLMKEGISQKKAAQAAHVSAERLRAYMRINTRATRQGRKWIIVDPRPETFWIATGGRKIAVTLTMDEGSKVGLYWNAVNRFLDTNDTSHLRNLKDTSVRDVKGKIFPLELGPNRLRRLDSVDELDFLEIYADVAR